MQLIVANLLSTLEAVLGEKMKEIWRHENQWLLSFETYLAQSEDFFN